MTKVLSGENVAAQINEIIPGAAIDYIGEQVWITPDSINKVGHFLKNSKVLDFSFLTSVTGVDFVDHFELVYHLLSMRHNHRIVLKARLYGRDFPEAPSVVEVWAGAELQEREIWDLLGIRFKGHPNMKRILLWEGFEGHPLRRDFIS